MEKGEGMPVCHRCKSLRDEVFPREETLGLADARAAMKASRAVLELAYPTFNGIQLPSVVK
jgi:hypothetical protein